MRSEINMAASMEERNQRKYEEMKQKYLPFLEDTIKMLEVTSTDPSHQVRLNMIRKLRDIFLRNSPNMARLDEFENVLNNLYYNIKQFEKDTSCPSQPSKSKCNSVESSNVLNTKGDLPEAKHGDTAGKEIVQPQSTSQSVPSNSNNFKETETLNIKEINIEHQPIPTSDIHSELTKEKLKQESRSKIRICIGKVMESIKPQPSVDYSDFQMCDVKVKAALSSIQPPDESISLSDTKNTNRDETNVTQQYQDKNLRADLDNTDIHRKEQTPGNAEKALDSQNTENPNGSLDNKAVSDPISDQSTTGIKNTESIHERNPIEEKPKQSVFTNLHNSVSSNELIQQRSSPPHTSNSQETDLQIARNKLISIITNKKEVPSASEIKKKHMGGIPKIKPPPEFPGSLSFPPCFPNLIDPKNSNDHSEVVQCKEIASENKAQPENDELNIHMYHESVITDEPFKNEDIVHHHRTPKSQQSSLDTRNEEIQLLHDIVPTIDTHKERVTDRDIFQALKNEVLEDLNTEPVKPTSTRISIDEYKEMKKIQNEIREMNFPVNQARENTDLNLTVMPTSSPSRPAYAATAAELHGMSECANTPKLTLPEFLRTPVYPFGRTSITPFSNEQIFDQPCVRTDYPTPSHPFTAPNIENASDKPSCSSTPYPPYSRSNSSTLPNSNVETNISNYPNARQDILRTGQPEWLDMAKTAPNRSYRSNNFPQDPRLDYAKYKNNNTLGNQYTHFNHRMHYKPYPRKHFDDHASYRRHRGRIIHRNDYRNSRYANSRGYHGRRLINTRQQDFERIRHPYLRNDSDGRTLCQKPDHEYTGNDHHQLKEDSQNSDDPVSNRDLYHERRERRASNDVPNIKNKNQHTDYEHDSPPRRARSVGRLPTPEHDEDRTINKPEQLTENPKIPDDKLVANVDSETLLKQKVDKTVTNTDTKACQLNECSGKNCSAIVDSNKNTSNRNAPDSKKSDKIYKIPKKGQLIEEREENVEIIKTQNKINSPNRAGTMNIECGKIKNVEYKNSPVKKNKYKILKVHKNKKHSLRKLMKGRVENKIKKGNTHRQTKILAENIEDYAEKSRKRNVTDLPNLSKVKRYKRRIIYSDDENTQEEVVETTDTTEIKHDLDNLSNDIETMSGSHQDYDKIPTTKNNEYKMIEEDKNKKDSKIIRNKFKDKLHKNKEEDTAPLQQNVGENVETRVKKSIDTSKTKSKKTTRKKHIYCDKENLEETTGNEHNSDRVSVNDILTKNSLDHIIVSDEKEDKQKEHNDTPNVYPEINNEVQNEDCTLFEENIGSKKNMQSISDPPGKAKKPERENNKDDDCSSLRSKETDIQRPKLSIKIKRIDSDNCEVIDTSHQCSESREDESLQSECYFNKDVKIYKCRLCTYVGTGIVAHYKHEHPHSEIPWCRFPTGKANIVKQQSQHINVKAMRAVSADSFQCRFCSEKFVGKNKNILKSFVEHIVLMHTGEYKEKCSECDISTQCPFNMDIPSKVVKGHLIGYICEKCNFIQISIENIRRHITNHHSNERTRVFIISMSTLSDVNIRKVDKEYRLGLKKKIKLNNDFTDTTTCTDGLDALSDDNMIVVPDPNCYTDKLYHFSKDTSKYFCHLCAYSNTDIIEHYKEFHHHTEIPLSRMDPKTASNAIEESKMIDVQSIINIPSDKYVCRFCYKEFVRDSCNGLKLFFNHVLFVHTGEYLRMSMGTNRAAKKKYCLESPKIAKSQGQLLGYICEKCNYTQIMRKNINLHIRNHHNNEDTVIYYINLSEPSEVQLYKIPDKQKKHNTSYTKNNLLTADLPIDSDHNINQANVHHLNDVADSDHLNVIPTDRKEGKNKIKANKKNANKNSKSHASEFSVGQIVTATIEKEFNVNQANTSNELETAKALPSEECIAHTSLTEPTTETHIPEDIFKGPHFNLNSNAGSRTNYACCINGKKCNFETSLLVSMNKHIQTKHTELWDGYCYLCMKVVIPPGHSFKKCLEHLLAYHNDTRRVLVESPVVGTPPDKPNDTPKAYTDVCPISQPITNNIFVDSEEAQLPKIKNIDCHDDVMSHASTAKHTSSPNSVPEEVLTYKEAQGEEGAMTVNKQEGPLQTMLSKDKLVHLYKCAGRYCSFSSDSAKDALQHASTHSRIGGEGSLSCAYCSFDSSGDPLELVMHVFRSHGPCPFVCGYCFYRAAAQQLVMAHIKHAHPDRPIKVLCSSTPKHAVQPMLPVERAVQYYKCPHACEYRTYTAQKFCEHLQQYHAAEARHSCNICSDSFGSAAELVVHMKAHELNVYQCTWCVRGADSEAQLLAHAAAAHPAQQPQAYLRLITSKDKNQELLVPPLVFLDKTKIEVEIVTTTCNKEHPVKMAEYSKDIENLITDLIGNQENNLESETQVENPKTEEPSQVEEKIKSIKKDPPNDESPVRSPDSEDTISLDSGDENVMREPSPAEGRSSNREDPNSCVVGDRRLYKCHLCDAKFDSVKNATDHTKNHHTITENTSLEQKMSAEKRLTRLETQAPSSRNDLPNNREDPNPGPTINANDYAIYNATSYSPNIAHNSVKGVQKNTEVFVNNVGYGTNHGHLVMPTVLAQKTSPPKRNPSQGLSTVEATPSAKMKCRWAEDYTNKYCNQHAFQVQGLQPSEALNLTTNRPVLSAPTPVNHPQVHKCGVSGCSYLFIDITQLVAHWYTVHPQDRHFHCQRCHVILNLHRNSEDYIKIAQHLESHNSTLFNLLNSKSFQYR